MENLFAGLLQFRFVTFVLFAVIAASGVMAFKQLPIDAFPDLVNNQVQIFSEAPGMGPEETEQLITIPLESALNGLPNVMQVRSISKYGLSVVTCVFGDETSTYFARQLVSERLQAARSRLPRDINPELGPVSTAMGEIYQYVLAGAGLNSMDLKTLNDWDVKYRLRSVPGVADVNTWGGLSLEYTVTAYPEKLLQYGISLKELSDCIERNNNNFGAGIVNRGAEQFLVRGVARMQEIQDIENTIIKLQNGTPITIRNVASIDISSPTRQGAVTKDGKGEVVTGIVMMLKGENSRVVIARVKDEINSIQQSLPRGVTIKPFYDQTALVEQTIETVRNNLVEGSALVIVVLLLTLGNVRAALLVAIAIPVSLMFSFLGMKWLGISANIMSLGAIDFGMIVDGSIVMMENIIRRLSHESDGKSGNFDIIKAAVRQMARPIIFGILIITIVYLPILSLQGMEYKMFSPMVFAVCFALLGSLLTALLLIPAMATFLFSGKVREKESAIVRWVQKLYVSLLRWCLNHAMPVLVASALVFAGTAASLVFMGTEFVPQLDEGDLVVQVRMPTSISLPESIRLSGVVERCLAMSPEVTEVESRIGRPELATDPMGVYQADVFVMLKQKQEWRAGLSKAQLSEEMRDRLTKTVPGSSFNFTQPISMRVDELVSGVKAQVAVKIFGDDVTTLQKAGREVEAALSKVRGVSDLQMEQLFGAGQIVVTPNRQKLARYGIEVEQIQNVLQTTVLGSPVSEIIQGRRRFKIRLRFPAKAEQDVLTLSKVLLTAGDGRHLPLSQVAALDSVPGMELLSRESGQRRIIVQCNVKDRDIGTFVKDAQKVIATEVRLPTGYYVKWGGQFENQQHAMQSLSLVVPASILAIFLLLTATFGSTRLAGLVLLNVPFALIGGVLALWARGMYLSVPATIGFIALFGVAVLNGIVLTSSITETAQRMPLKEAIETAAVTRLRPVLMTASVATLGFLPMAASHGAGAEVQKPLATVVIGGLITSTFLTLLVLPVIFSLLVPQKGKQ
jgi:heavy metal efflux system protein